MDTITSIPPAPYFSHDVPFSAIFFPGQGGIPIPYPGPPSISGFLEFLAKNSKSKFDAEPLKEEGEKLTRRKVIKVQAEAEFESALSGAKSEGKLVLVAFSPKKRAVEANYLPLLGHLSHTHEAVLSVLEVDTAEQKTLAIKQSIQKAPTFKLYKEGQQIDSISGYEPEEILQVLAHWLQPDGAQ